MKKIGLLIMAILMISNLIGCGGDDNERWAAGDYAKAAELKLDVDAVMEAFKKAKNPQAFEKKVNEIYTGNEIISISVENKGETKQEVTLYIDDDPVDGKMTETEKIIQLTRAVGKEKNQTGYSRHGYGPYGHYTSPMTYMATGALLYWAMSRPYYRTPMTSYSRIRSSRTTYRKSPAYRTQQAKTKSFSKNFYKNAKPQHKTSTGKWGGKAKSNSWSSGVKRAKASARTRSSRSRSSSSGRSGK